MRFDVKFRVLLIFFVLLGNLLVSENLTIWVSWEGLSFFEEKSEEFNKYTGHNVEILFVPDMEEKLLTSIRTGNLPDLALIKDVHSVYLTHVNTLYRIKDEDLEQLGSFREEDLRVFSVNNEVVAIPYYADLQVAFVNQRISKELGLEFTFDYTIDDIKEIKKNLENSEIIPAAWDFMSPYVFYPFLAHGAELIDKSGKLQMDTGSLAKTIRNIKELFDKKVFERYERGALVEGFSSGRMVIIFQGSYLSLTFEQNEINFEILPFPIMNGKRIKGLIDSKGFAILNSVKEDVALEFIDFLYSISTSFCEKYYKVPLWTESDSKKLKDLRAVLKESQYMEQGEKFQRLYFRVMGTVLQTVYSGTMSVEESLQNAQEFVNKNW